MSVLDNILNEIYNDINSHKRDRNDVILSAIRSRLDKNLLTYKKEMKRRSDIDAVKIDKLIPKKNGGRIRVE